MTVTIDESQRQMLVLALAKLSIERPGWVWTLGELAAKFSTAPNLNDGRALFDQFREIHHPHNDVLRSDFHVHLDTCRQCSEHPLDLCERGAVLLRAAVDAGDRP